MKSVKIIMMEKSKSDKKRNIKNEKVKENKNKNIKKLEK